MDETPLAAAERVRRELAAAKARLEILEGTLGRIEGECRPHDWENPVKSFEKYTEHEADLTRPIKQGVHLWYETRPVEKTRPQWTRRCKRCGKVETTTATDEKVEVHKVPRFPGRT